VRKIVRGRGEDRDKNMEGEKKGERRE